MIRILASTARTSQSFHFIPLKTFTLNYKTSTNKILWAAASSSFSSSSFSSPSSSICTLPNCPHHFPYQLRFFSSNSENTPTMLKGGKKTDQVRALLQTVKLESALEKGGENQMSVKKLDQAIPKYSERAINLIKKTPSFLFKGIKLSFQSIFILFTNPKRAIEWFKSIKAVVVKEAKHYWLGMKLLYADITTSTRILSRVLKGHSLSRRERKQLQRTVTDLFRLVPFAIFVIIPFMEFLLPVALKMFPNMLPSTFQDSLKREEDMKRQLRMRLAMAEFLQDTVKDFMKDARDSDTASEEKKASAKELLNFVERAQSGDPLRSDEIVKFASLFNDELMLDNISRPQLVGMCKYMGFTPYGNDNFLRYQLRSKIRQLKKDDQEIVWEGVDALNKEELQMACMERGMRATGLTKKGYLKQLNSWLDLSINKNVPASLLIMSRAFNITALDSPETALATSMISMNDEVVNEVVLQAASTEENNALREMKLESIRYQNELIADEEKDREEVAQKMKGTNEEKSKEEKKMIAAELTPDGELVLNSSKKELLTIEKPMDDMATDTESTKNERRLSLAEVLSLESLVFKSSVEKERKALENIKQLRAEMSVDKMLALGRIGGNAREDKSAGRMMKKLETMIEGLEKELETVDKTIGDSLNFLDKDMDGVLSAEELKIAVKNILRAHNTEEDAEWAVQQIDEDHDGKVTVEQLVKWVEKRAEMLELTGDNPEKKSTTE